MSELNPVEATPGLDLPEYVGASLEGIFIAAGWFTVGFLLAVFVVQAIRHFFTGHSE